MAQNKTELLADYLVTYLYKKYKGNRHVRRVATWIGFLLKAIEHLPGVSIYRIHTRQVGFDYKKKSFKARFNHKAGPRGGVDIVNVLPGRGAPEGDLILSITNLDEAENVYKNLKYLLDKSIVIKRND